MSPSACATEWHADLSAARCHKLLKFMCHKEMCFEGQQTQSSALPKPKLQSMLLR